MKKESEFQKQLSYNREEQKRKTYKSAFYSINSLLGNDWAIYYILIGGAQTGKSYSIMDYCLKTKRRLGDKCKFYWLRLTDSQMKKLLSNGADRLVDPDLKRKYNFNNLITKGDTIYTYDEETTITKNGKEIKRKTNLKEFCVVQAASTMANSKGVGYFDKDFDGEYILVLDEMNREVTEKNNFDICYSVARMVENIVRDTHMNIKFFMIGNDIGEASDLLTSFNFIPDHYGRFKLKRQRAVIDYIAPNEQYKAMRSKSIANQLNKEIGAVDGHNVDIDRSLLVNRRKCIYPVNIIKFTKERTNWFTLWEGNIISPYNNEKKPVIAMRRYLDEQFSSELLKSVQEQFDNRCYKFTNLSTFKRFQMQLKLIKKG